MTESILRALEEGEVVALQQALALAARMAKVETALGIDQVQALYDAALDANENDAERLIAIGLAFGNLIVDDAEFEWARISDEWGEETCVAVVGKMVHCAPISMIQKRIGRADPFSIAELREGTLKMLRDAATDAADR